VNLVLITHPAFLHSQSMPRFARSLAAGFAARGHAVSLRAPRPVLHRVVDGRPFAKWAGYADQYLLFPRELRAQCRRDPADTLYVFCDQALGPWVPTLADRPHIVHCHDLLALRSAIGDCPENPTAWTGRVYQRYIRRGFRRARHFVSVSERTRTDLHAFGGVTPVTSEVVHNGLNFPYAPLPADEALRTLRAAGLPAQPDGMVLHVSGHQWYKNVRGVLCLYARYARARVAQGQRPLPLWLVGVRRDEALRRAEAEVPAGGRVEYLLGLDNHALQAAYSLARVLLFPSLAEGFGWPIVEAQACGCPVVTTDDTPMTEVGGPEARYLPRLAHDADITAWAEAGAGTVAELAHLAPDVRAALAARCAAWSRRFDADAAIDRYLAIYQRVLAWELAGRDAASAASLGGAAAGR
jgi:glycosyltransferase involved in cell wall biosynthesis